jgi:hypothetical protein
MSHYRDALGARRMVPHELERLGAAKPTAGGKKNP